MAVLGLDRAGPNLTVDSFINGLESIRNYNDIFNGHEVNYGPDKHQGANSSFLAVVKGGAGHVSRSRYRSDLFRHLSPRIIGVTKAGFRHVRVASGRSL